MVTKMQILQSQISVNAEAWNGSVNLLDKELLLLFTGHLLLIKLNIDRDIDR